MAGFAVQPAFPDQESMKWNPRGRSQEPFFDVGSVLAACIQDKDLQLGKVR